MSKSKHENLSFEEQIEQETSQNFLVGMKLPGHNPEVFLSSTEDEGYELTGTQDSADLFLTANAALAAMAAYISDRFCGSRSIYSDEEIDAMHSSITVYSITKYFQNRV